MAQNCVTKYQHVLMEEPQSVLVCDVEDLEDLERNSNFCLGNLRGCYCSWKKNGYMD